MQSFFPWELKRIIDLTENENLIQEIKISSRPSNYEYIEKCLDFYINGKGVREIVSEDFRNYYLFARQANLIPYFNQLQYEEIEKIKYELWE